MAADYLWLWDNINSVWVKAQCDASGNLTVDLSGLPATFPLPAAQVTDLKAITSYPDPIISQTTPMNLRHVPHGYYATGTSYLPYAVDSAGKLLLSIAALQHLSDIADVNLTGLTTGDFIYWDASTSKWERIAHANAVTGVHGAGSNYLALSDQSGLVVSKVIWKATNAISMSDLNRTTSLGFTDLDLTSVTSANAKLVILRLHVSVDSITAGTANYFDLGVRKNGDTPTYNAIILGDGVSCAAGSAVVANVFCGCDSGQVVEYAIGIGGTAQIDSYIIVLGYIE